MKELHYESNLNLTRQKESRQNQNAARKWREWTVPLIVWLVLIVGSFMLAQHYIGVIQQSLTQIQTDTANLNQSMEDLQKQLSQQKENAILLQEQFQGVENELQAVKEEISLAGDTLNSSDETKKALNQRITDLSKELEGLRTLIKKLEEAARVY